MVVTARQLCFCEHGTLTLPATEGPATHTIHRSLGRPSSSPLAVSGNGTNSWDCSPPPTTSQRYRRAPLSHAFSDGRNHAQLTTVRITRDSSAPRNFSKASEQVR